jgi:hypothetical protein
VTSSWSSEDPSQQPRPCVRYKKFLFVVVDVSSELARLGLALIIAFQFQCTVRSKEKRNLQRTKPREV